MSVTDEQVFLRCAYCAGTGALGLYRFARRCFVCRGTGTTALMRSASTGIDFGWTESGHRRLGAAADGGLIAEVSAERGAS